jgi:anthranilate synthase/aminodeoxychorismate synthase-like glutamine amidotransferase
MKIVLIDNYDSFTYNLAQYIGEVEGEPEVLRNDKVTVEDIEARNPDAIIISPGPGTPSDSGVSMNILNELDDVPTLGVCLGHQCIAESFGGNLERAERLLHGKTSRVFHGDTPLYDGVNNPVEATRYHSLLVEEGSLPNALVVDARSSNDEIMGLHHGSKPLLGVQFHPESILTEQGRTLISNFLNFARNPRELGDSDPDTIPTEGEETARD